MRTFWLVAKYIPDMRRREPMNVGVVLWHEGRSYLRFLGEKDDGNLDGRRLRWAADQKNYRAWVKHWRKCASAEELTKAYGAANYFIEHGGERIAGSVSDPMLLLDDLYTALVESRPDRDTLSITRQAESVIAQAGLADRIQRKFWLRADSSDELVFDYRYDNGAIHLMQRIQLSFADERSWEAVHAAAWTFERLDKCVVEPGKAQRRLSLVKTREQDAQLERQLHVLEEFGAVVNVGGDEIQAATDLRRAIYAVAAE